MDLRALAAASMGGSDAGDGLSADTSAPRCCIRNQRALQGALQNGLHRLRRTRKAAAREAAAAGTATGFGEWLCDNYHLLAAAGEECLTGWRFAPPLPPARTRLPVANVFLTKAGIPGSGRKPRGGARANADAAFKSKKTVPPALLYLLRAWLRENSCPDTAQLSAILSACSAQRPLTVAELDSLSLCLKTALFLTAADACREVSHQQLQAARDIEVAVQGLRLCAELDFEALCAPFDIAEETLRCDPSGVYPRMDERSRVDYRRRVALAAQQEGKTERDVAARAVACAKAAGDHVGAHLPDVPTHAAQGRALLLLEALVPLAAAIALSAVWHSAWLWIVLWLPLWELARPFLDGAFSRGVPVRRLPRLELDGVIPEEGRCVIAVCALLPAPEKAGELAAHLDALVNTNGCGAVQVCLLADLKSAPTAETDADAPAIEAMRCALADTDVLLAVRRRAYSPTMKAYTGRERKRGALEDLARYIVRDEGGECSTRAETGRSGKNEMVKECSETEDIRKNRKNEENKGHNNARNDQSGESPFFVFDGDTAALRRAKYILALDADTGLPMDTAAQLISIALHPAHTPVVKRGRVVSGYGVLAPRIAPDLQSASQTPFARAMAGRGGTTPYDAAVGERYMDFFGSGIYAGKGLLDVRALLAVTEDAFPSEQVLSHDSLEGALLRCGFVSDVEVTDGCPATMAAYLSRAHRWVRGDTQNLPLALSALPLTALDRYKLLDNLRRAATPIVFLLGFCLSPFIHYLALTLLLCFMGDALWGAARALLSGGAHTLTGRYYSRIAPRTLGTLAQTGYSLLMLPATALTNLDAMARAAVRLVTRRRLLQWTAAADSGGREAWWRYLPPLLIALYLLWFGRELSRLTGLLFALLPLLALLSARGLRRRRDALSPAKERRVRGYARAMWRYYEELCGAEDHFLPPDNLQEAPVWRAAHRTSPTNIGLYLLCTLAAHDLTFISQEELHRRIGDTLDTVERLEKWRGNLFNWYETRTLRPLEPRYVSSVDSGNLACCLVALRQGLLTLREDELAARAEALYRAIDLTPMYNAQRGLFYIGLDPDTGVCSPSYYDLLMSESRMTGYFAVASRQVPKKHWGKLSRALTRDGAYVGPVSWTGTMFEYFMPRLLLPAYEGTMGYEALRFCLRVQRKAGSPWGMSESGFYAFDSQLNYQYKAHGAPGLALKRGLGADHVIAPYASFLTLTTAPGAALRNLECLQEMGMTGRYGFFEAADFTAARVGAGGHAAGRSGYAVVRSYMAHHLGMSLLACANALLRDVFPRRFLRDRDMARAVELLTEKAPDSGAVVGRLPERTPPVVPGHAAAATVAVHTNIDPRAPRMHLLTGGEWSLAICDNGASVALSRGLDVTQRSADLLRRPQGVFTFIDAGEGIFSPTAAPVYDDGKSDSAHFGATQDRMQGNTQGGTQSDTQGDTHRAVFGDGYADFHARHGSVAAGLRVTVHPRMAGEQRQLVLKNLSARTRTANVMFYLEPCLAPPRDAAAHPAFSRLFLSVQHEGPEHALVVTRRHRAGETPAALAVGFLGNEPFIFETSREKLLIRPLGIASLHGALVGPFSNEAGGVPDAVAALRATVTLPPRSSRSLTLVLAAAPTEEEALMRLADMRRQGQLLAHNAARSPFSGVEAALATSVLPDLFYPPRMQKTWAEAARNGDISRDKLWALGISGDLPIVLLEMENAADVCRAEPYLRLHAALRRAGFPADLAILYREEGDYNAPVLTALRDLIRDTPGVYPLNIIEQGEGTRALLTALCVHNAARDTDVPTDSTRTYIPLALKPVEPADNAPSADTAALIRTRPPRPWCHVLANPVFGTLVSDMALGYTWACNARENKLTPWTNDVCTDNRGELLLLQVRSERYDTVWGAAAAFSPGAACWAGKAGTLATRVDVRVPVKGMYKTVTLTVDNPSDEVVPCTVVYYTEPVLGVARDVAHDAARLITAKWDDGALYLRNPLAEYPGVMVLTALGGATGCDCDRRAFLSGGWGAGTLLPLPDGCAAVYKALSVPPRGRTQVTFVLGFGATERGAQAVPGLAAREAEPLRLNGPKTGDAFVDRWLPWQVTACRLFARTGFYQCGGAYGFRDQLQDALAALHWAPQLTKRQLLRGAGAQFTEGDVLHWWHDMPGGPRGVRTRCSDDLAWLPVVAARYVAHTGDTAFWRMPVRWLTAPELEPSEQERYFAPMRTDYFDTMYTHGIRALQKACTEGARGLPLMGGGDWNDGMNRVGAAGKGESVWLGMFLVVTIDAMLPHMTPADAAMFRPRMENYRCACEACFEKDRYLRAFCDDGTPLGRAGNESCAIDSLTQSFAVFAGLDPARCNTALDTALRELVDEKKRLVKLFTPPFWTPDARIGYITAYPPGVRENGGQYTHAAVWLALALQKAGHWADAARVLDLLDPRRQSADYGGEPYAMAADVYTSGRAGWTLYTGAAGWYYQAKIKQKEWEEKNK
ncbi:MAG: DUF3131 domain-containing protein [Oscillospiraceae bacterium]|nr:DUF3131 domain-containing protein [Oscillospiraceae bacterium]